MMTEVTKETELVVRMSTEPANMARLIAMAGALGVEMLAHCPYHDRDSAVMLLVTDDPVRMSAGLRAANFRVAANDVVLVHTAYTPRLAMRLGDQLRAAGVGVRYSYASWTEGQRAYLVFKTTDDNRAVQLLQAERLAHDVAWEKTATDARTAAPMAA